MIIVSDDENRENEGDLICAAEFISPEIINFMASEAKGLICAPLSETYAKNLQLEAMVEKNTDNHGTAFTVSVDHIETSTGISAFERALTIKNLLMPRVYQVIFVDQVMYFHLLPRKWHFRAKWSY